MTQRRVAVLYPAPYADTTPCVRNAVASFVADGWSVDFLGFGDRDALTACWPRGVTLHLDERRPGAMALDLMARSAQIAMPHLLMAIDRSGLFVATRWRRRRWRTARLVYFATESFLPPLFTGWRHAVMNFAERIQCRQADVLAFPSRERAALHARHFRSNPSRHVVLPNGPTGPAHHAPRTDALARHLGTDASRPHVLYAGSLTAPNRIEELVRDAAENWPADWVLVLHGRVSPDPREEQHLRALAESARCTIRLSTQPVAPARLAELVAGADVAVALYREDGPTFQTVGTGAGKIAEALHAGVPVVCSPLESLAPIMADGGGRCADVKAGLRDAITALLADTDARANAAACFARHFAWEPAWRAFAARLE